MLHPGLATSQLLSLPAPPSCWTSHSGAESIISSPHPAWERGALEERVATSLSPCKGGTERKSPWGQGRPRSVEN